MAVTLLLMIALFSRQSNVDAKVGAVEVEVKAVGNGNPIQGVSVRVGTAVASTSSNGRVSIANLKPGTYSISLLNPSQTGFFLSAGGGPTEVTIRAGEKSNVNLDVIRGGIISGRALDLAGQPIVLTGPVGTVGLHVVAARITYEQGRPRPEIVANTRADDRGAFRLPPVGPGEYLVYANVNSNLGRGFIKTYFPGTADFRKAEAINVRAGTEVANVNLTVQANLGASIKGRILNIASVVDKLGARIPLEFYLLSSDQRMPLGEQLTISALDRSTGRFELTGIVPGPYSLFVHARNAGTLLTAPVVAYSALTPVEAFSQQQIDLSINLQPNIGVAGKATLRSGDPSIFKSLRLAPQQVLRDGSLVIPENLLIDRGNLSVGDNGEFSVPPMPPGRYTLALTGHPENVFLSDVIQDGESVYERGYVLSHGSSSAINVVLDADGATLSGTVRSLAGKPAAYAAVLLVPTKVRRSNPAFYRTTTTTSTGTFTIRGLAPGDYGLLTFLDPPSGIQKNAAFLNRYDHLITPVALSHGETRSISLQLLVD